MSKYAKLYTDKIADIIVGNNAVQQPPAPNTMTLTPPVRPVQSGVGPITGSQPINLWSANTQQQPFSLLGQGGMDINGPVIPKNTAQQNSDIYNTAKNLELPSQELHSPNSSPKMNAPANPLAAPQDSLKPQDPTVFKLPQQNYSQAQKMMAQQPPTINPRMRGPIRTAPVAGNSFMPPKPSPLANAFGQQSTPTAPMSTAMAANAAKSMAGNLIAPQPAATSQGIALLKPVSEPSGQATPEEIALLNRLHGGTHNSRNAYNPHSAMDQRNLQYLRTAMQQAGGAQDFNKIRTLAYAQQYGKNSPYYAQAQKIMGGNKV